MNKIVLRLLIGAAMLAALASGRVAKAGQYIVTYVGTGSYIQGSGGSSGASGQNASCQVSGSITATYTWHQANDNDPAPASALITEQCTAGGGGYGYQAPPAASASDDLGDPQTGSPNGNSLQVMSTGFRYSVQSGSTFTTTCSPSASASVALGSISVSASYSASAVGVTIGVNGLTSTGPMQWGVLVGQGLAVTVSTPGWGPQEAWQWSITGDPFAGFQTTPTTGGPVELSSQTLQSPGFTYFYRSIQGQSPQSSTVTCVVSVEDPKGTSHPATGSTQISVYAPTVTLLPAIGFVAIAPINGNPYLISGGSPGYLTGITWQVTVTPPAQFAVNGANGNWAAAQLIQPKGNMTKQDGTTWQDANQGVKGLDGAFPYLGHTFLADGTLRTDSDSPGYQLLAGAVSVTMSPTFWTTIVYQPNNAGQGTTWVPLQELDWWAGGGAVVQGSDWVATPQQGPVNVTNNNATSTLPTWTVVNKPAGWVQVQQ